MRNPLKDDEDFCNALTSDSACNAYSTKCSWCLSAAVKPSCHSIENAKALPSAVFQCSNLGQVEKKPEPTPVAVVSNLVGDDQDYCSQFAEARCLKETEKCSWCKSGAVADACNSIENAKALPPSIFFCSNMGDLSNFVKKEVAPVSPVPEPPVAVDTSDMFAKRNPLKDDEDFCNALTSDSTCNA